MRPTELENLLKTMRTEAPSRLDRRIYATIDQAAREPRPRMAVWRIIMQSPITKMAIAAALIIGMLFLAQILIGEEPASTPSPEHYVTVPSEMPSVVPTQNNQALARTLYEQRDQAGLLDLLSISSEPTQIAIAGYLGEIGSEQAIPALQKLADAWQGQGGNPYLEAIDRIEDNLIEEDVNEVETFTSDVTQAGEVFTPQGVLSGLVTDALSGKPVVDLEIEVWGSHSQGCTDERGFYSIEEIEHAGNYMIKIKSTAYLGIGKDASEWIVISLQPDQQVVRHFDLQPACQVEVQVVDEQGEPLEGVDVSAGWLGSEYETLGEAKTDPNGLTIVGSLETSQTGYRIIARHKDYAPNYVDVEAVDVRKMQDVQIRLPRGMEVYGYAEYADGVPAVGIGISAQPQWWNSSSCVRDYPVDEQGNFVLPHIVPDSYRIWITTQDENNSSGAHSICFMQTQLPLDEDEPLDVRVPGKSPGSLASIQGSVRWLSERRSGDIDIIATNLATNEQQWVMKDVWDEEQGDSFVIGSLEPGTYRLEFEGVHLKPMQLDRVQAPCRDLEVVLEWQESPYLFGTVIDQTTQQPMDTFAARIVKLKALRGANYIPDEDWIPCKDGQFNLEVAGPGFYCVEVKADGYALATSPEINTDEPEIVTVELGRGGTVGGKVVDSNGRPVSGATVIPLSQAHGNMPRSLKIFVSQNGAVQTKEDGTFTQDHLTPGIETMKVIHPEYTFKLVSDIEVMDGQESEDLVIVLSQGGAVQGVVYDDQGHPDAGVTLYVQDADAYGGSGRLGAVVTDDQGRYELKGLPVDKVCYVQRRNVSDLGLTSRAFVPLEGKTTQLDLGGTHLLVGSLQQNGLPIENHRVFLTDGDDAFRCTACTNDQGQFSMLGIPAGRYVMHVDQQDPLEWTRVTTLTLEPGDTDLGVINIQQADVEMALTHEDFPDEPWTVSMRQGTHKFLASRVGKVRSLDTGDSHYLIEDVSLGTHLVCVSPRSSKGWRYWQEVDLTDANELAQVSVQIPRGTASISGFFDSPVEQPLTLWKDDGSLTVNITPPGESYHVDHLPAGQYQIGNSFVGDLCPLVEFSLSEDEHKGLDLDTTQWPNKVGSLVVYVIDEQGHVLSQAQAWLEGTLGRFDPWYDRGWSQSFFASIGNYYLNVECEGYETVSEQISIEPYRLHNPDQEPQKKIVVLKLR